MLETKYQSLNNTAPPLTMGLQTPRRNVRIYTTEVFLHDLLLMIAPIPGTALIPWSLYCIVHSQNTWGSGWEEPAVYLQRCGQRRERGTWGEGGGRRWGGWGGVTEVLLGRGENPPWTFHRGNTTVEIPPWNATGLPLLLKLN